MSLEQVWRTFTEQGDFPQVDEATQIARNFEAEIHNYCELIQGMGKNPLGFMIRGEDAAFTARACHIMERWNMPKDSISYYASLAEMFEHKRAFLKLEWHKIPAPSETEHLVAFYFRRRPSVPEILRMYQDQGVPITVLDRVALTALTLEKNTVHFVAGAARQATPIRHKLYFSQYVTPDSYAAVLKHLLEIMDMFKIEPQSAARISQYYGQLLSPQKEQTVFLSLAFSNDTLMPSIKIDFPEVVPQIGVLLLPETDQPQALSEIQQACESVNRSTLAYMGVRLFPDRPLTLKYYLDIT